MKSLENNQKGQVTIFLIVGIVLLIGFTLVLFLFSGNGFDSPEKQVSDVSFMTQTDIQIDNIIGGCVNSLSKQGIKDIFSQGGYAQIPPLYYETQNLHIPVYFPNNLPSKQDLKILSASQLSAYIQTFLPYCVGNFSILHDQGVIVEKHNPLVSSIIKGNAIEVNVNYPLTYIIDGSKKDISDFKYSIKGDFDSVFSAVDDFMRIQEKSGDYFPYGDLLILKDNRNISYTVTYLDVSTLEISLYFIVFNDTNEYVFNYAVRYPWSEGGIV